MGKAQPMTKHPVPYRSAEQLFADAYLAEKEGRPEDAEKLYRRAVARDLIFAPGWLNLGSLLYDQLRLTEAEECYRKALKINPRYAKALFSLGNCLEKQGRKHEALYCYTDAIKADSSYPDPYVNAAILHEEKGMNAQALECWETYLTLSKPSKHENPFRKTAKERILVLRVRIKRVELRRPLIQ